MPHEQPLPPDLLATAREVLLNEILPALPADKALAARMIASAMAIAARAAAQDPPAMQEDARALAAAIRAGHYDPATPDHARIAALLDQITRARCAVSAPRALGKG